MVACMYEVTGAVQHRFPIALALPLTTDGAAGLAPHTRVVVLPEVGARALFVSLNGNGYFVLERYVGGMSVHVFAATALVPRAFCETCHLLDGVLSRSADSRTTSFHVRDAAQIHDAVIRAVRESPPSSLVNSNTCSADVVCQASALHCYAAGRLPRGRETLH